MVDIGVPMVLTKITSWNFEQPMTLINRPPPFPSSRSSTIDCCQKELSHWEWTYPPLHPKQHPAMSCPRQGFPWGQHSLPGTSILVQHLCMFATISRFWCLHCETIILIRLLASFWTMEAQLKVQSWAGSWEMLWKVTERTQA